MLVQTFVENLTSGIGEQKILKLCVVCLWRWTEFECEGLVQPFHLHQVGEVQKLGACCSYIAVHTLRTFRHSYRAWRLCSRVPPAAAAGCPPRSPPRPPPPPRHLAQRAAPSLPILSYTTPNTPEQNQPDRTTGSYSSFPLSEIGILFLPRS